MGRLTTSAKATVVRRSFMRRRKPVPTYVGPPSGGPGSVPAGCSN